MERMVVAAVVGVTSIAGIALWLYFTSDDKQSTGRSRRGRRATESRSRLPRTNTGDNAKDPSKQVPAGDHVNQPVSTNNETVAQIPVPVNNGASFPVQLLPTSGNTPTSSSLDWSERPAMVQAPAGSQASIVPSSKSPELAKPETLPKAVKGMTESATPAAVQGAEQSILLAKDASVVPETAKQPSSAASASVTVQPSTIAGAEDDQRPMADDSLEAAHPSVLQGVTKWERVVSSGGITTVQLHISKDIVGRFIGRSGRNIKQLQAIGARVAIQHEPGQRDKDCMCNVSGEPDLVQKVVDTASEKFPSATAYHVLLSNGTTSGNEKLYKQVPCAHPGFVQWPDVQMVDVHVVDVESISCFHVHLIKEGSIRQLNDMHAVMHTFYQQTKAFVSDGDTSFRDGFYCACRVHDSCLRGQVVRTKESGLVDVLLLDFGSNVSVPVQNLYPLRPEFCYLPFQAVRCSLAHIAAKERYAYDKVSLATETLRALSTGDSPIQCRRIDMNSQLEQLPMEITSTEVELYIVNPDKADFLNRQLVDDDYAVWIEEAAE